jgi:hypothetical protein
MMPAPRPIETHYQGCRFRSRLEARWAVFFDALGIRWEYEPQGFIVKAWACREPPEQGVQQWPYLPDFFLPDFGCWVEVKGSIADLSADYLNMIAWTVDWGGQLPGMADSLYSTRGLLWLGPIPAADLCCRGWPVHPILQHSRGGHVAPVVFDPFNEPHLRVLYDHDEHYFDATWSDGQPGLRLALASYPRMLADPRSCPSRVAQAYTAARSARFEHGESPNRNRS